MALQALLLGHAVICSSTQQNLQVPENRLAASNISNSSDPNYELLLVDVRYGNLRLTNSLGVLQGENGLRYVPIKQLGQHLNFHLFVVPLTGQVNGFLSVPSDRIELKTRSGTCKRKGETIAFDPSLCFEKDGELFAESQLFAMITGLQFSWRIQRLELEVRSELPLNVRNETTVRPKNHEIISTKDMEVIRSPYKAFSFPALDLQFSAATDSTTEQTTRTSSFGITGIGDLGYMNARYRLGAGSDGRLLAGLSLGREDSGGGLLGPLRATRFEFGDLSFSPVSLLTRSRSGIGFSISNSPLIGSDNLANENIEGHGRAGSTIELYRNNIRLSSLTVDSTGKFVFKDIPLEGGPNVFQIVEITNEGEVREEERTLYGDASGPRPGENRYQISASQVGSSVFGINESSFFTRRNELIGQYQLGLTSGSWMSATIAQLDGDDASGRYFGAGYHSWGGAAKWHLNAMVSDSGGSAISGGIWQKFGSNTISLEHTRLNDEFRGTILPEIDSNATSVTKLRFDGIGKINQSHLSYGISADRYDGTNPATLIRARLSGGSGDTYFSNTMTARVSNSPFAGSGLIQIRKRMDRSSLRFDMGYGFGENTGIHSARIGIDKWLSPDYRYRYGLEYDEARANHIAGVATIYRAFGPIFVGLNFSANLRGGISTNLLLSAGVNGLSSVDSLQLVRPGSGELGSVSVRVFLDRNLSGTFDEGDLLLPGVGIKVGRNSFAAKTNGSGICNLERLMTGQEIVIALNEISFENPSWMAEKPGVVAILRPGSMLKTDLAVIESAEIEGRISGVSQNTGYVVWLVNPKGEMKQISYVDDEFGYVFSHVRPGDYTLVLRSPEGNVIAEKFIRALKGEFLKGYDFTIQP